MRYKDAVSTRCPCGLEISLPYPSMQRSPSIAPSEQSIKEANEALVNALMYHQNKECPWMHNERVKAQYSTTVTV